MFNFFRKTKSSIKINKDLLYSRLLDKIMENQQTDNQEGLHLDSIVDIIVDIIENNSDITNNN